MICKNQSGLRPQPLETPSPSRRGATSHDGPQTRKKAADQNLEIKQAGVGEGVEGGYQAVRTMT